MTSMTDTPYTESLPSCLVFREGYKKESQKEAVETTRSHTYLNPSSSSLRCNMMFLSLPKKCCNLQRLLLFAMLVCLLLGPSLDTTNSGISIVVDAATTPTATKQDAKEELVASRQLRYDKILAMLDRTQQKIDDHHSGKAILDDNKYQFHQSKIATFQHQLQELGRELNDEVRNAHAKS